MKFFKKKPNINTQFPYILLTTSLVGLVASFWQSVERVGMLKNPEAPLGCNLNPIMDCSGVLDDGLSALFGFPNSFMGIVLFSVLFTASILLIFGGVFTKKFGTFVLAIGTIMTLFPLWFFLASLYSIGKICLFCIFIWLAVVPMGWYGVLYWLESQKKLKSWQKKLQKFGANNYYIVPFVLYVMMFALFLIRFRDYYFG